MTGEEVSKLENRRRVTKGETTTTTITKKYICHDSRISRDDRNFFFFFLIGFCRQLNVFSMSLLKLPLQAAWFKNRALLFSIVCILLMCL